MDMNEYPKSTQAEMTGYQQALPYPNGIQNQPQPYGSVGGYSLASHPPPPPLPPPSYGQPYTPHMGGQRYVARHDSDRLRGPAIVMASIGCCCGAWLCSLPALVLALMPECYRYSVENNHKAMYTISIILSVLALLTTLIIVITFAVSVSLGDIFNITNLTTFDQNNFRYQ